MKQFVGVSLICLLLVPLMGIASEMEHVAKTKFAVSEVEKLADGFKFTEGPVWHKDGYLLFSDIPSNAIVKYAPGSETVVWNKDSGNSNGLTYDLQGNLLSAEHGNHRIACTDSSNKVTVIADNYQGKKLNSPNDLTVRSDGMIFFTDPDYGLGGRKKELDFNGVYRVMPGSEAVLLTKEFNKPNGIALSPDESILYVADSSEPKIRAYDLAKDGSISNGRVLIESRSDGLKLDVKGNLYLTAGKYVSVYSPSGKLLEQIEFPSNPANCGFGGPNNKTLYVTARQILYSVEVSIPGVDLWRHFNKK